MNSEDLFHKRKVTYLQWGLIFCSAIILIGIYYISSVRERNKFDIPGTKTLEISVQNRTLLHEGLPLSGFGLKTVGGKGGQVIKVTNLKNNGPGSLKAAIETAGPRIIVFEVGGVIDLERATLSISEPFVTIAGQTAPSPGITLIKGGLEVRGTHDVIVQHITVRTGEAGRAKQSGWNRDAIEVRESRDVIIDHCTATWGTDENLSVSGPEREGITREEWWSNTSQRVTISNCIIAHGLNNSTHSKGGHSMGSLIHDSANEILIYGNLYAHNRHRNPVTMGNTKVVIANNYIYNWGISSIHYELTDNKWGNVDPRPAGVLVVQSNELEPGPSSTHSYTGLFYGPVEVYWNDTPENFRIHNVAPVWLKSKPFWPEGLITLPRSEVKKWVIENAGSRPWERDEITARMIFEIIAGGGKIIDSETEAGGYPSFTPTYREFNIDEWDMATITKKNSIP